MLCLQPRVVLYQGLTVLEDAQYISIINKIQAPIGACIMRPGETRQSDTRQKHGHRFNSNLAKASKGPNSGLLC